MSLNTIERIAREDESRAWIAINEWLERNVNRATDEQLVRALLIRDQLSGYTLVQGVY
jgi:hypothetical protein